MFCRFVVCPFGLFHLVIVLSVHRFTDSDYPFGIFKLFLLYFDKTSCSIFWPNPFKFSWELWVVFYSSSFSHFLHEFSQWEIKRSVTWFTNLYCREDINYLWVMFSWNCHIQNIDNKKLTIFFKTVYLTFNYVYNIFIIIYLGRKKNKS